MILAEASNDADVQIAVITMWQSLIVGAVTGGLALLGNWLVNRKRDAKLDQIGQDSAAVHQSINNRPNSVSDRLDDLQNGIDTINVQVKTLTDSDTSQRSLIAAHGERLDTHIRYAKESDRRQAKTDRHLQELTEAVNNLANQNKET